MPSTDPKSGRVYYTIQELSDRWGIERSAASRRVRRAIKAYPSWFLPFQLTFAKFTMLAVEERQLLRYERIVRKQHHRSPLWVEPPEVPPLAEAASTVPPPARLAGRKRSAPKEARA